MTYIRTRDEALNALADTLDLPERRVQLIDLMVKIAICLDPEPRNLLADAHATLVRGDLAELAKQRRSSLEAAEADEVIVIINPEEDRLFDLIGHALDRLRLARVAAEVFPELAARVEPWRLAHVVRLCEEPFRQCLTDALRGRRDTPDQLLALQRKLSAWVDQCQPSWESRVEALRTACTATFNGQNETFLTLASGDDELVVPLLERIATSPEKAREALLKAREILDLIHRLDPSPAA